MCYLFSQMNLFPSHNKPIKVEEGEGSYGQHRNNGGGGGKGGKGGGGGSGGGRAKVGRAGKQGSAASFEVDYEIYEENRAEIDALAEDGLDPSLYR